MRVADTHAHLEDEQFDLDRDEVILRAVRAGVTRILAVGSNLDSSKQAIALAHRYPEVYAAVGLHPHHADRFEDEASDLHALLDDDQVVAVGEIGLDYHREWSAPAVQATAFRAQLSWAVDRNLPVSVHSRGAEREVLNLAGETRAVVVMHCFGGDLEAARLATQLGYFISFAGNVTFPHAEQLRDVARTVSLERMLVESDAPVLAPQAHRGRRNEPAYVVDILSAIARERAISPGVLAETLEKTAGRVFGWGLG